MAIPLLETRRLVLRPFVRADVDALWAVLGDAEAMAFYPHPLSHAETSLWIERNLQRYERLGFGLLGLTLIDTGELVGDCGPTIQVVEGADELEIGWHVRRDLWNRGLASEAAVAVRDWVWSALGRTRLISLVRPENVASCRVAEKLGMTVERLADFHGYTHRVYAMSAPPRPAGTRRAVRTPPTSGPSPA